MRGTREKTIARPTHRRVYYGWVLVVALAIAQVSSWGVLYYAFSVFLEPMQRELGWSRATLTAGYSIALLISGAAAFPVGAWLDRRGPRLLMSVGSLLAALLVFAWSRVTDLPTFYLIWAGIGLAMAAVLYEPAFFVVSAWFTRQRGRALTVLTFIGGFASIIYIPLAAWLVQQQGWRAALGTLAVVLVIATLPIHLLLVRRRPGDLGLQPDGTDRLVEAGHAPMTVAAPVALPGVALGVALRQGAYWRLTLAFFLATITGVAVTVHLIPYLIGQGYSPDFAALAVSLFGIIALPGRAIFTPLGDFIPRRLVTAVIFLSQALSLLVLLLLPGVTGVLAFAVLFGIGFGAVTPARAALVAEMYGPAHYGRINGVLAAALMGARALAPVGVSLIYDQVGDYTPAWWTLASLSLVAALIILTVRHAPSAPHATPTQPAVSSLS